MAKTENFNNDLTQGSVSRQLMKFAMPFLLSNLLQALYSVADMIIVGQFCGKSGITGVSIGGQINMLVMGAAIGLSVGGTVLVAQYGGAKLFEQQKKTIGTLTTIYIILSAVITAGMLIFGRGLLTLLKTPENAFGQAEDYFNICISGTIFMFLYNAISAVLRGMGDSKRPLWFVAIAAGTNVVLDLILVGKFGMAAAGAAWATIAAQALSVLLSIIYLVKKGFFAGYKLSYFKPQKEKVLLLIKLGLPASVQSLVVSLSFLTLTALVNSLPGADVASACQGIGGKINSFAVLPAVAMNGAIASMAGQNIGAGEYDRAKKTMMTGMWIAMAISAAVYAIVNIFPEFLIKMFDSEPEVIRVGAEYLHYISLDYVLVGCCFCLNALAVGAGYTYIALINALFSSIILRVPMAYFFALGLDMGFNGVGLAIGIASIGSIIIGAAFVKSGKWKKPRLRISAENE